VPARGRTASRHWRGFLGRGKIAHNLIAGTTDKAFSFQNKSTGAVLTANKLDTGIGYEGSVGTPPSGSTTPPNIGGAP
jgi:hypothetical protein